VRILVTNDDGIDSIGLHVLARAMRPFGEVVIAAPDEEYSGYGAAVGSLLVMNPEVRRSQVEGIDEAWSITAPPALCVMFGRMGFFGEIDLVVAGINPGANVGRSIYHSGTVGACLTARNGGISGVAVSQSVDQFGVEGQGWEDALDRQQWDGAADIAALMVAELAGDLLAGSVVLNINVHNRPASEMEGWLRTEVGAEPPRSMDSAQMIPKPGHDGTFHVEMSWGEPVEMPLEIDCGAVMAGYASVSWLGRITSSDPDARAVPKAESALDDFFA